MKRLWFWVIALLMLFGCKKGPDVASKAMDLRTKILNGAGCEFVADVTADYSDALYTFKMQCSCDDKGNVSFEVLLPDSIAGITGRLSAEGGQLTFDDHALLFSMLADGRISPVSAPWVLMRAVRSGYISGCGEENGELTIRIDDSYNDDALQVVLYTDNTQTPCLAEIFYRNNRILTISIESFSIL